jgi:ATP phosphoribosyltransferase regulatory subunit
VSEPSAIRLPVGVRDFLPQAAARRRAIAEALLAEFERWGYDRIITPAFEYLDVLARGLGADARAAVLRFVEPATGEVVALRPDITPQVARIAATRLDDGHGPVRLCYEGSVLRLAAGARGQRELIQAGVELVDAGSPSGDAEVLALADAALRAAHLGAITLDVGHVALVRAALAPVVDAALRRELGELIARKDGDGVARAAHGRVPPRARRLLAELPGLYGAPHAVLARARALPLDRACRDALDELERALALASAAGAAARLTVDLGDGRGFEYYTGLRFAGFVVGVGDAVLRGGRYDDLVGRYGRPARATGFAIDVEAIAQAEQAVGAEPTPAARGWLIAGGPEARRHAVAAALRRRGDRVTVDHGARTGAEALAYAAEIGARATLMLDARPRVLHAGSAARPLAAGLVRDPDTLARALGPTRGNQEGDTDGGRRHRRRPVG